MPCRLAVCLTSLLVLGSAACGDSHSDASGGNDAGSTIDAGAFTDAGVTTDAGVPTDAGTNSDGGTTTDAGAFTDAGVTTDAGVPTDAGTSLDGGTTTDAGAFTDAGSLDSGTPDGGHPQYTAHVDCQPVNDFGYIAAVKGDLPIGARDKDGLLTVVGTLNVRYHLYGDPETVRDVQVSGTIHNSGQYLSLKVLSGASDLDSMYLVSATGSGAPDSVVHSPHGDTQYQTKCTSSTANVPQGSDLHRDGEIKLMLGKAPGGGTIVQIPVQNVGNLPAKGYQGRASVGGFAGNAVVHSSATPDPSAPAILNPNERGYIELVLPSNPVDRCTMQRVVLDLDHTFQGGDPDPFADDADDEPMPCITWSRPITEAGLEKTPDAHVDGVSLAQIVGSYVVARVDGNLCSKCHYQNAPGTIYRPEQAQGTSKNIGPTDVVGGRAWLQQDGWMSRFLATPGDSGTGKPQYIKDVLDKWVADGSRP